jgi:hypothetical protein
MARLGAFAEGVPIRGTPPFITSITYMLLTYVFLPGPVTKGMSDSSSLWTLIGVCPIFFFDFSILISIF